MWSGTPGWIDSKNILNERLVSRMTSGDLGHSETH